MNAGFSLWNNICRTDSDAFSAKCVDLFTAFFVERRKAFDADNNACNAAHRLPRVRTESKTSNHLSRSECGSDVASSTSSVGPVVQKKSAGGLTYSAVTAHKTSCGSIKSSVKTAGCSCKGGGKKPPSGSKLDVTVSSKKSKKLSKKEVDPTVINKLKKSSNN